MQFYRFNARQFLTNTFLCVSIASTVASPLSAADKDWPQWRGPNRDGRAADQRLLSQWPEEGPKLAWQFDNAGFGFSSVAIQDGKLFTQGKVDNRIVALCLDAKTGKEIWRKDYADGDAKDKYSTGWGDGPRSTPTIDGDRVYFLSDLGTLACLNASNGEITWSVNFVEDFGGSVPTWGYSESVLIDGDKVIATPGGPALLVGLDKKTGKKVWESKKGYEAQYVSVVKANFDGIPTYVTASKPGLIGIHAITGEELFTNPKTGNGTAVIPTPIIAGNRIYHSSGYGAGNVALDISKSAEGLDAKEVYHFNRQSMESHHGGYVLDQGTIYGFSKAMRGVWMAQDLATGDVLWNKKIGSSSSGSIAYADGMLYCYDDSEGVCYLAKATKDGWEELGKVKLPSTTVFDRQRGAIWTHPVIADGKLFIRDHEKLFAFDIAK